MCSRVECGVDYITRLFCATSLRRIQWISRYQPHFHLLSLLLQASTIAPTASEMRVWRDILRPRFSYSLLTVGMTATDTAVDWRICIPLR